VTPDDAFLQAILESPDDDTPRLVYADWQEERGDPRGEFIRVQVALARLPADDPRREELEARERQLFQEHGKRWAGPLRGLVRKWEFRRGFVEAVTADARHFVRQADSLFRLAPVRQVTLRRAGPVMDHVAGCPHLARLRCIDFCFSHLGLAELWTFLSSPYLNGLRDLRLCGNHLGVAGVRALLASCLPAKLTRLELGANRLDAEAAQLLATSAMLRGLTHLDMSNNPLGPEGVRALASSSHLEELTSLDLGFTYAGPGVGEALGRSPYLGGLRELHLLESDLGDEGMAALVASRHLVRLATLWLDDNGITVDGVRALARSPVLRGLEELGLSLNPGIGDAGAACLAGSPNAAGLRRLALGACEIGALGGRALAGSVHLGDLEWIDLVHHSLGPGERRALCARFGHRVRLRPAARRAVRARLALVAFPAGCDTGSRRQHRPRGGARPMPAVPSLEQFTGCLLGLAVGDAVGAPFEGLSADNIFWGHGPATELVANAGHEPLYYTDDTEMMVGVAEALAECGQVLEGPLCRAFAANYHPERGYGRGARLVIEAMAEGRDWRTVAAGHFPGGSYGNGAAMRVAPVGLLFCRDLDRVAEEAKRSALPTHVHPLGIEGAQLLAVAVALALRPGPLDRRAFYRELRRRARSEEFRWAVSAAARLRPGDTVSFLGNSLEAHRSVVTAVACFASSPRSYEDAVARAIGLGDDTDTLAAMTGALAGAHLGVAAIPARLLDRLEDGPKGRSHIGTLAARLHERFRSLPPA
jgi:poly(ADP-ribose) glycohydrolase ARH3